MTEPIFFRRSFPIAVVSVLQALLAPVSCAGTLTVVLRLSGVDLSDQWVVVEGLAAALAIVLLQPPSYVMSRVPERSILLAFSVLGRWMLVVGIMLAIGFVLKFSAKYSRRVMLIWVLVTPAVLIVATLLLHQVMRRLMFRADNVRRVVFAGCNEISCSLAERIDRNPELCMSVAGFFDDRGVDRLGPEHADRVIGRLPDLSGYVKRHGIDVIFIALPLRHIQRVMQLLDEVRDTTASIYFVPDVFVFDLIQARTGEILGIPVVAMCETPFSGYRGVIKRITDVVISSLLLILAAPLMLLIAIAVKFSVPGPVLFTQRRYGLDGEEFMVYKFRTMTVTEDGEDLQQATKHDTRITPIGRILRQYSLDELPQLINVLQGRMSLVGPRPHAVAHNEEYRKLIKGYMIRHKVPPGITGLAQINGCRGETARLEDMQARVKYDLDYLRRWSPILDLQILALTVIRIFRDDKAY